MLPKWIHQVLAPDHLLIVWRIPKDSAKYDYGGDLDVVVLSQ